MSNKPLGFKNYGSIPHLSFSRLGPGDYYCEPGMEAIATQTFNANAKSKGYRVIVQIKLDGTNVGVARINGNLVPLVRAGYTAASSPREMHHLFHEWAMDQAHRFHFLEEGERVVGEWLAQAHGTRYRLPHDPFVAFDIFSRDNKRKPFTEVARLIQDQLMMPELLHCATRPFTQNELMGALTAYDLVPSHGDLEPCEGAIYRVECGDRVLFLCKYVRPGKVDGKYLQEGQEVWNWRPVTLAPIYQP